MKQCKSCGRPCREDWVCVCKTKGVGNWGQWKSTTKVPPSLLTEWQLKKYTRLTKCGPAVEAARRRAQNDDEFFQGGEEHEPEQPEEYGF